MGLLRIQAKPKRKKATAKQIKDREALREAAKALKEKWANAPKFSERNHSPPQKIKVKPAEGPPKLTNPPGRERQVVPSLSTAGGSAEKKPDKVYTGTAMKGVATMHKSNSVPVFDDQHLVDIANMRRNDYTRDVKQEPNGGVGILPPSDQL